MARTRTKMVKIIGYHLSPEPKLCKVPKITNNYVPPAKVKPGRAKESRTQKNLSTCSIGELAKLYERERKQHGENTRFAARLRAAFDKAKDAGGAIVDSIEDSKLETQAARKRWPISDRVKDVAVQSARDLMDSEKLAHKAVGLKAIATFERMNQIDEHHADPQEHHHTGTITLQAAAIRQEMLKDPDYLDLLRKRAMPTNGATNGASHG